MNFNFLRRKAVQTETDTVQAPPYMISGDMIVTLVIEGKSHTIGQGHPNHSAILEAIGNEDWSKLPDLMDIPAAINTYAQGNVTVNEFGEVTYKGEQLHNTITSRITQFYNAKLPVQPLVNFLENLMENPSFNSREQLYSFLENEGMPITEDGCFIGYKGVTDDLKDCHTRTFDNSPGQVHEMDRSLVDDNPNNHCSNGFHVGAQQYASTFGARTLLVKVNPRDAVSVPSDHNCQKLRCCRYEVMEETTKTMVLQEPMYGSGPEHDEEDYCDYCGEVFCSGECQDECLDCGEPYSECYC